MASLSTAAATERSEVALQPRIVVTADMSEPALAALRALGEVKYASFRQAMRLLSGAALVEELRGVQVFITEIDILDVEALRELPDLRVIAACRGQAVNVDLEAASAFGIPVLHAPGRNAEAVADLTLAFMLMLARKLPQASAFLRQPGLVEGDMARMGQAFTTLQGIELWQKTVGLIGLGAVGRAVARRLVAFGARVVVHDPCLKAEQPEPPGIERATLEQLLELSDFVSLHAAVTDQSRGMIGAPELARMKPGSFLVNTARAALVDQGALVEALRSGHLAGAAVDVFPIEPPGSDHPLLVLENVIATPHVGGNTVDVATHQGEIIAADLERLLDGERPRHVLNPDVLRDFDWTRPRRAPDAVQLASLAARPAPAVSDIEQARKPSGPPPSKRPAERAGVAAAGLSAEVAERMGRIVRGFLDRVVRDESLRQFAAGKHVTLHFTITDLPLDFHLRLRNDAVAAAVGEPDGRADVELSMRADVLDGMFTGRINPMQAATGGRLSFRGDTMKAMTLQHVQQDLSRLYREARAEVGDPGDLTASSVRPEARTEARTARPLTGGPDIRLELVRVVNELYAQELITATGGNVSVRVPETQEAPLAPLNQIWITPSQMFKGNLEPEMLVRLDLDGNPLDTDAPAPSSERLMHCAVYRARSDAHAVIHAHAPNATILANTGLPFLPISTEAAFFGELPRVPFIMPGTEELAREVGKAMEASWAVLMRNHGLIVAGRSLRRTADMVEIIERTAEIILGCYAVGKQPTTLPEEVVQMLRKMGDLMA